jgi:flagellin
LNGGAGVAAGEFIVSQGANSALKFQSGANSDAFIQINTRNILTASTGAYAGTATEMLTLGTRITSSAAGNLGALTKDTSIDVWQTAFKNAAAAVDSALEYISTERSVYGAQSNRLSYISNNLQAQSTNLQNSRSAIIDTDFAAETAKLTRGQIMQQAATAMLAQANQMPNVILSLLK